MAKVALRFRQEVAKGLLDLERPPAHVQSRLEELANLLREQLVALVTEREGRDVAVRRARRGAYSASITTLDTTHNHAERDPATGSAVMMERRAVLREVHHPFGWMKRLCGVPAAGLFCVAGPTAPAESSGPLGRASAANAA
jgi:hypothetical protein